MVPVLEPEVNATDTFKLDPAPDETWPVTLKVVPEAAIAGKHEDGGLFTAVTVPVRLLPFWLKFTVKVVLGGAVPWEAVGANVIFQLPVTTGV